MGKTRQIKDAVIAKLIAMGSTTDGTHLITVLDNTKGAFEGYPSAQVLPLKLENKVLANHQMERTSGYAVLLHIPLEDTAESEQAAYNTMYDLVDLITDTFDTGSYDMGLGFVLLFETTLADYQVVTMKNGVTLLVRIDIKAMYTKDV